MESYYKSCVKGNSFHNYNCQSRWWVYGVYKFSTEGPGEPKKKVKIIVIKICLLQVFFNYESCRAKMKRTEGEVMRSSYDNEKVRESDPCVERSDTGRASH